MSGGGNESESAQSDGVCRERSDLAGEGRSGNQPPCKRRRGCISVEAEGVLTDLFVFEHGSGEADGATTAAYL